MSRICKLVPDKGVMFFDSLKSKFGRNKAVNLFNKVNPEFLKRHSRKLKLDSEGFPTVDTFLAIKEIRDYLGELEILYTLNSSFNNIEDTRSNYDSLVEQAYNFNTTSPQRDKYVAVVEQNDVAIRVTVKEKTTENEKIFKEQYGAKKLNQAFAEVLEPLGVTIGDITEMEKRAGRRGVTNFEAAKRLGKDCISIIRVSNDMEGAEALAEENCHLLIGVKREEPLIKRALSLLSQSEVILRNVLGNDYEATVKFHNNDMSLVAEEVLGQMLRDKLVATHKTAYNTPTLVQRVVNYFKTLFKKFKISQFSDPMQEVEAVVNNIARQFNAGNLNMSKEDIYASRRNVQFNSFRDKVEKNLEVLQKAINIETKRYNIVKNPEAKKRIRRVLKTSHEAKKDMENYLNKGEGEKVTRNEALQTIQQLCLYIYTAATELAALDTEFEKFNELDFKDKFKLLNKARIYLYSYEEFLQDMLEILSKEDLTKEDNIYLADFTINGATIKCDQMIRDLRSMHEEINIKYKSKIIPVFTSWLESYFGESIVMSDGTTLKVRDIVKEARNGDIGFADRWVASMSESSDELLQMVGIMLNKKKDEINQQTVKDIKDIQEWYSKAESAGYTEFSWVFERDNDGNKTGYYIRETHWKDFSTAFEKYKSELIEDKTIPYKRKIEILTAWCNQNKDKYRNPQYDSLTDTQKELLEEYVKLKHKYESNSYHKEIDPYKCIQDRKSSSERLLASKNPIQVLKSLWKEVKNSALSRADDIDTYGNMTSHTLVHFDNSEYLTIPMMYVYELEDPNEISDDITHSLMKYAYSTNNYKGLNSIADALELGNIIVHDKSLRKTPKIKAGKILKERFIKGIETEPNTVYETHTNIEDKYEDFMKSSLYQIHKEPGIKWRIPGTDKILDVSKLLYSFIRYGTTTQMSVNWNSDTANTLTGLTQGFIESLAGQYFSRSSLKKADAEFISMIFPYASNLTSKIKNDKLHLFMELFDTTQDFNSRLQDSKMNSLANRILGLNLGFAGQNAGNLWLYNRTAIAMCIDIKVKNKEGEETTLWDVLEIEDVGDNTKRMIIPEGVTDMQGNPINLFKIKQTIKQVNMGILGNYSEEEMIAANRYILGSMLMMYRRFIMPQFLKRFRLGRNNMLTNHKDTGFYIDFILYLFECIKDFKKAQFNMLTTFRTLNEDQQANVKRALFEALIFIVLTMLITKWGDDDEDKNSDGTDFSEYLYRLWNPYSETNKKRITDESGKSLSTSELRLRYFLFRLHHEIGFFVPSPTMADEWRKTFNGGLPILKTAGDVFKLLQSLLNPFDWMNEIKAGPYKGMSTLERNFFKAPIPGISQYKHVHDFLYEVDQSILFYKRSN